MHLRLCESVLRNRMWSSGVKNINEFSNKIAHCKEGCWDVAVHNFKMKTSNYLNDQHSVSPWKHRAPGYRPPVSTARVCRRKSGGMNSDIWGNQALDNKASFDTLAFGVFSRRPEFKTTTPQGWRGNEGALINGPQQSWVWHCEVFWCPLRVIKPLFFFFFI